MVGSLKDKYQEKGGVTIFYWPKSNTIWTNQIAWQVSFRVSKLSSFIAIDFQLWGKRNMKFYSFWCDSWLSSLFIESHWKLQMSDLLETRKETKNKEFVEAFWHLVVFNLSIFWFLFAKFRAPSKSYWRNNELSKPASLLSFDLLDYASSEILMLSFGQQCLFDDFKSPWFSSSLISWGKCPYTEVRSSNSLLIGGFLLLFF